MPVREVRAAVGAGYVYAICGDMRTMPGLPTSPNAERIDITEDGSRHGPLLRAAVTRRLAQYERRSAQRQRRISQRTPVDAAGHGDVVAVVGRAEAQSRAGTRPTSVQPARP